MMDGLTRLTTGKLEFLNRYQETITSFSLAATCYNSKGVIKSFGRNAGYLGQIKTLNASQIVITSGEIKDVFSVHRHR